MSDSSRAEMISRRAELLAEMFLEELGAKVTNSPSLMADYLAFFESAPESVQIVAIQVEAIETPLPDVFPLKTSILNRAAGFNVPTLLLVIDVKLKRIAFAWLDEIARTPERTAKKSEVLIPLKDAEVCREEIQERLLASATVHT